MADFGDYLSEADPSSVGMVLMFGTVTFTATAMAARSWLLGDSRALRAAVSFSLRRDEINAVENSYVSIFVLLYHGMMYGLVLLICYVMEHHPPFPSDDRSSFDPDYLIFLVTTLAIYSITTFQRNDGKTEEEYQRRIEMEMMKGDEETETGLPSLRSRGGSVSSHGASTLEKSRASKRSSCVVTSRRNENANGQHSTLVKEEKSALLQTLEEDSIVPRSVAESTLTSVNVEDGENGMKDIRLDDSNSRMESLNDSDTSVIQSSKPPPQIQSQYYQLQRRKSAEFDLLNMDQTYEWKGLLSLCFLIYQLTDAESLPRDVNLYYNASRAGASCFVFLTGFGHAMYFYTRNNYRVSRVLRVLLRLNLTCFFLCLTMGNKYIFYAVCPLHSLAFLMSYAMMRINRALNYSKYGLRIKMLVLAGIIFLIWDFRLGLFEVIFNTFFSTGPASVALPNGPLWEWYYQTHLHHWAAFVGIIYAINYPITHLLLDKTESMTITYAALAKTTVALALCVALSLWVTGPFTTSKYSFDSSNAYFAFLPILCYIYFRNITQYLRERHMTVMKMVGQYTLEIYLLHHHLFLTNNGQSLIVLLPGYPKCNIILVSLMLFFTAQSVYKLTVVLSAMVLPNESEHRNVRSVLLLLTCVVVFYSIAYTLQVLSIANLASLAITIVILGFLAYQTVMDMTWQEYRNAGRQLGQLPPASALDDRESEQGVVARLSPPLIGGIIILVLGILCQVIALEGATTATSPLSAAVCESFVNDGVWVPVSACTEFQKGLDTREHDSAAYYRNCPDISTLHWGWRKPLEQSSNQCRFRSRSAEELQKHLRGKTIVFVGDLMVRNLFHALCRAVGDSTAGRYDAAVAEHADVSKKIGNTRIEYKWAPLAFDQVVKLKEIRTKSKSGKNVPDLIMAGGGTLDRLHVWATDEDTESHKEAVQKLAKELDYGVAPTVWCTPTTINSPALGSEEKRTQMNELAIQQVRTMYSDLEVDTSANFVLDGPSYSRGRVAESFDGVLYPRSVYDAGIQIVANAFDWLLPMDHTADFEESFDTPPTGTLSNPFLGLMMACFCLIGLFFFDGYLGFSYLSSLFVRRQTRRQQQTALSAVMPSDLFEEAFMPYHQKLKLPMPRGKKRSAHSSLSNGEKTSDSILLSNNFGDSDLLSLLDGSAGGSSVGVRRTRARSGRRTGRYNR